jgi:hypothetical protein
MKKLTVQVTKMDGAGKPVRWNVQCAGTCKRTDVHTHIVFLNRSSKVWTCNCPDNEYRGSVCKHIRSTYAAAVAEELGYKVSFFTDKAKALRQRKAWRIVHASRSDMYAVFRMTRDVIFTMNDLKANA